jgi:hypothetical protein
MQLADHEMQVTDTTAPGILLAGNLPVILE